VSSSDTPGAAEPPEPPADMPAPPDQEAWDEAAQDFMLQALSDVQESAEKWSTALGGLLGLFGTVALVSGPDEISKVSDGPWQGTVIGLVIAAGLCAGIALYLAAVTQMRPRPDSDNWNGTAYQIYVIRKSQHGAAYLNASRVLGVIAAVLIFAAGIAVLIDGALSG
jgi:hypothetical protein